MKRKFNLKIFIILILVILLIGIIYLYGNQNQKYSINEKEEKQNINNNESSSTLKIKSTGEVEACLTEKIELHATYYYSEIYVEENKQISKGEKILKYTNGEYLLAPYDCIVTSISVPNAQGQCTSKHYIEVSAINTLEVSINVNETNINNISVGQEANVEIPALEKTFQGYITNISSTADNGEFTVKVEFENDGNIKLGMTANVEIVTK